MSYHYPTLERPQTAYVIRWKKEDGEQCSRCDATGSMAASNHDTRRLRQCDRCEGRGYVVTGERDGLLHYRSGELKTFPDARKAEQYADPMRNDPRWRGYTFMVEPFVVVQ